MKKLLLSLCLSLLLISLSKAETHTATTGNLITNGNFETGNANGWTQSGDGRVITDCCALPGRTSNYDYEFGDSGSISQQFDLTSDDITQTMLDNGITLNSTIEAQNGECGVAGCWGGSGGADTFTNTLSITDASGEELATVTQIRKDVTGINGQDFTDQLIYTGTGSYYGDITISGTDANAPATLGGPNVDNISVTMTYDPTVIVMSTAAQTSIKNVTENLSMEFQEIEQVTEFIEFFEFKEEFKFENTSVMEEEKIEEFTYIPFEMFEEEPKPQTLKTEFQEMAPYSETMKEEPTEMMNEFLTELEEENSVEEAKEEPSSLQAEQPTSEEPSKETQTPTQKPRTSQVADDNKNSVSSEKKLISLPKIMDKIDAQVKEIDKNLVIKNLVKLDAMVDNNALLSYQIPFYKERKIYEEQANIRDDRIIYTANLETYSRADPIFQQNSRILELQKNKKRLKQEIWLLKSKIN